MQLTRTLSLGSVLALFLANHHAYAADGWGASYSFGPTTSRITYAKTTLVPGRVPTLGNAGPLFIWPGMSNPTSDLIQTTLNAYANNGNSSYCGATSSQWCAEASVFGSFGQRNGPAVAIDPDDHVTIEYRLGTDGNTWTQTVTSQKLGKVVSTLQSQSGQMPKGGFGFATEAQNESFTIDTQYYLCTELHFAEADPNFAKTGSGATGANHGATGTGSGPGTAKNVHTPDGGLTWLVDLITLPAMNPQGTQSSVPTYNCSSTGGTTGAGGSSSLGGTSSAGGSKAAGGTSSAGGSKAAGGTSSAGGSKAAGGTSSAGGSKAAGGAMSSGGVPAAGGTSGNALGGAVSSLGGAMNASGGVPTGTSANPVQGGAISAGGAGTSVAGVAGTSVAGTSVASAGGTTVTSGLPAGGSTSAPTTADSPSADGEGCNCRIDQKPNRALTGFALFALGALLLRRRSAGR